MAKFKDVVCSLLSVLFILLVLVDGRPIRIASNKVIINPSVPRCGVPDHNDKLHTTKHYSFLKSLPWDYSTIPLMLNYALSPEHIIDYINISDIRVALERAFSRWSSVIPVDFTETQDYEHANITIGFYYGDHGDRSPFDDRVLAHASGPGPGAHLHFNAAQTWAVDFNSEKSKRAFDLETIAVHEIGHLLGLDHSSIRDAVMWPSELPRTKHVELALDDVNGAQALYGANPNTINLDSLEVKQAKSSFGSREVIIICISIVVLVFFISVSVVVKLLYFRNRNKTQENQIDQPCYNLLLDLIKIFSYNISQS
ncbi:hypothetical protein MKX03_033974 [Papaver bracteatum]|nr:hypothetical protein MKX03_033974 [Papaver bracteatum]